MAHRIQLTGSIVLSLVTVSALASVRARAQDRPAEAPPEAEAERDSSASSPTQPTEAAPDAQDPPAPSLDELAEAATRAQPPPPPSHEAMRALDDLLSDEADDPIRGVQDSADRPSARLPSRAATARAIERLTTSVRACATDSGRGVVGLRVALTSRGRVANATVETRAARLSARERACIERAAERAQIASREPPRMQVNHPIRL